MGRWFFSSVAALALAGCTTDGEYACSDASMCIAGGVPGQCESTGFCSFPDTGCPSGRRYGEFAGAGLAYDCVPEEPTETESNSDSVGSSTTVGTTGTSTTTLGTTTASTTSGVTTGVTTTTTSGETDPLSGSGDDTTTATTDMSTSGPDETSATESESASETSTIEAPPCADYNFEDAAQAGATLQDITIFGDDFRQSCLQGSHADVVFYWVAPVAGTYEFYADVDHTMGIDVVGALWDGCDGEELICDDDGGDVIDSRIVVEASAGEEFLWVVNAYGTVSAGFDISITPI